MTGANLITRRGGCVRVVQCSDFSFCAMATFSLGGATFRTTCNKNYRARRTLDKTPCDLLLRAFYVAKYKSKASVILYEKWQFIFALPKSGRLKIRHSRVCKNINLKFRRNLFAASIKKFPSRHRVKLVKIQVAD
jgi:hypothetical protein